MSVWRDPNDCFAYLHNSGKKETEAHMFKCLSKVAKIVNKIQGFFLKFIVFTKLINNSDMSVYEACVNWKKS